jgi:hypothetical protein
MVDCRVAAPEVAHQEPVSPLCLKIGDLITMEWYSNEVAPFCARSFCLNYFESAAFVTNQLIFLLG